MTKIWLRSSQFYILAVVISGLAAVLPSLGITPEYQPQFGESASGVWVDHPHGIVVAAFLYYVALAMSKIKDGGRVPESEA